MPPEGLPFWRRWLLHPRPNSQTGDRGGLARGWDEDVGGEKTETNSGSSCLLAGRGETGVYTVRTWLQPRDST